MFNKQLVADHAQLIRTSIARLETLATLSWEEFAANPDNFAIAEHHLRRALQAVLDLGRHVVVKAGLGNPANYREIFDLLESGGVLEPEVVRRVRGMAGYRNRLVHDYARIEEKEMWDILRNDLGDVRLLLNRLLGYITKETASDCRSSATLS
ncbi:MAG: DUF86 domain-containing protein [Firmicutes bacterium]|nr:DUF86 domain-containing protein [Bacillota bacterium]